MTKHYINQRQQQQPQSATWDDSNELIERLSWNVCYVLGTFYNDFLVASNRNLQQ